MNAPPLKIKNLSYRFGKQVALDGVSFQTHPGKMNVLLGKNGAGKTTLFSLIARLYSHREGGIEIFGERLDERPSACLSKTGIVFQQRTLDLELSVRQNLKYHCLLHGMDGKTIRSRIGEETERLNLTDKINVKIRELSGGEVRRVEIARSLLHGPKLLLMDECTVGLDVHSRKNIIGHVRELCSSGGLSVLWSTHLLDEVEGEDHLVLLSRGRVESEGAVSETLTRLGVSNLQEAFYRLSDKTGAKENGAA